MFAWHIHKNYPIKFIVIILNKLLALRSVKSKENNFNLHSFFVALHLYWCVSYLCDFPSLWTILLTVLAKRFYWQQILSIFAFWAFFPQESLHFSFPNEASFCRVHSLGWWFLSLDAFSISLHCPFASEVGKEMSEWFFLLFFNK